MTQMNKFEDLNNRFVSLGTGMTRQHKFRDRWWTLLTNKSVEMEASTRRGVQVSESLASVTRLTSRQRQGARMPALTSRGA